ncbi:MAG: tyrosine-protein phosphatase [Clostridiales bacterium]|nr:tyrosine-protein phosphatase [Clostridia bacterium]MCR4885157.1 tyrosine-protein phosphatase [Clostridiales bacterium]
MLYFYQSISTGADDVMADSIGKYGLTNTRDLGETVRAERNHIIQGKLYRSAELCHASPEGIEWIRNHVSRIIDLRTYREIKEKPDPWIEGVEYVHLPIMENLTPGVTHDDASYAREFINIVSDPDQAREYMLQVYRNMILNEYARKQYRKVIDLLMEERPLGTLWHCTAGKDRAGFAAVLVEELLDVPRDEIFADYMRTNLCRESETESMIQFFRARFSSGVDAEKGMRMLFGADLAYFSAWYLAATEAFGGMDSYICNGLGITGRQKEEFQRLYLRTAES